MKHSLWPSITKLANVCRALEQAPKPLEYPYDQIGDGNILYKAKIKLHGANVGVSLKNGQIRYQSRKALLGGKGQGTGFGFSNWGKTNKSYFISLETGLRGLFGSSNSTEEMVTLFGEWCGPGVQKHVALADLKDKILVVFAIKLGKNIVSDPDKIMSVMVSSSKPKELHVMPWFKHFKFDSYTTLRINFNDKNQLERQSKVMETIVAEIDREDPFVRDKFGVKGNGEGLVWFPVSLEQDKMVDEEVFEALSFKTKGESHQMVNTKVTGSTSSLGIVTPTSPQMFVDMFLTKPRLAQGLSETCEGDVKKSSESIFVQWIVDDIKKESKQELQASKLSWSEIEVIIRKEAARWLTLEGTCVFT